MDRKLIVSGQRIPLEGELSSRLRLVFLHLPALLAKGERGIMSGELQHSSGLPTDINQSRSQTALTFCGSRAEEAQTEQLKSCNHLSINPLPLPCIQRDLDTGKNPIQFFYILQQTYFFFFHQVNKGKTVVQFFPQLWSPPSPSTPPPKKQNRNKNTQSAHFQYVIPVCATQTGFPGYSSHLIILLKILSGGGLQISKV